MKCSVDEPIGIGDESRTVETDGAHTPLAKSLLEDSRRGQCRRVERRRRAGRVRRNRASRRSESKYEIVPSAVASPTTAQFSDAAVLDHLRRDAVTGDAQHALVLEPGDVDVRATTLGVGRQRCRAASSARRRAVRRRRRSSGPDQECGTRFDRWRGALPEPSREVAPRRPRPRLARRPGPRSRRTSRRRVGVDRWSGARRRRGVPADDRP